MSSRTLIVGTSLFTLVSFGFLAYYGITALSPQKYSPEEPPVIPAPENAGPKPAAAAVAAKTEKPPASEPSETPRLADKDETAAYLALMPKSGTGAMPGGLNMLDAQATPAGKNAFVIAENPSALMPTSVWLFDSSKKTLTPVVDRARGAMASFSKKGAYRLVGQSADDGSYSLVFENVAEKERRPFNFSTLPLKCALRDDRPVVYCAVPEKLPRGTVLPDDWLKRKIYTDDRFVMADFQRLEVREIGKKGRDPVDAVHPLFAGDELIFTNRRDGKVYKIRISS